MKKRLFFLCTMLWVLGLAGVKGQDRPFITTWEMTSADRELLFERGNFLYDYDIDWGDGTIDYGITYYDANHIYDEPGVYQVKIYRQFPQLQIRYDDRELFRSVEQWGDIEWESMEAVFGSCNGFVFNATDAPNLSKTTNMSAMFYGARSFNSPMNHWDVGNVTDMSRMFSGAVAFNQDLSNWDVGNVSNMSSMFYGANVFNSPIGQWDVSNVTDMSYMFYEASAFNQDIGNWNVGQVQNMSNMFSFAYDFNQDLNSWSVGNVLDMSRMFYWAYDFNGDISSWNTEKVQDMSAMFQRNYKFNQDLSNWNVSNVRNMEDMFGGASLFNSDLSTWDVSNVYSMSGMFNGVVSFNSNIGSWDISKVAYTDYMFANAHAFNQDISKWNVSKVIDMSWMFAGAKSFNQDISNWDMDSVLLIRSMFEDASSFNQDISNWNVSNIVSMHNTFSLSGLSQQNYDAILIEWSKPPVYNEMSFRAEGMYYCNAVNAREYLINTHQWRISEDEYKCLSIAISSTLPSLTDEKSIPITIDFSDKARGFDIEDISIENASIQSLTTSDSIVFEAILEPDLTSSEIANITVQIKQNAVVYPPSSQNEASGIFSIQYSPSPLSLSNNELSISTKLYPNPTTGQLQVEFPWAGAGSKQLQVFNSLGQELIRATTASSQSQLDLSHLPAGTYMVQITVAKGVAVKMVVRE